MAILAEYRKVFDTFPEFRDVVADTRAEVASQAAEAWGITDGGFMPGPREFGETTIRPEFFGSAVGADFATRKHWEKTFVASTWGTLINGNQTIEDVYIGIVGWMFPNTTQRTKMLYQEYGQTKLPIVDYEGEIELMEEPVLILEKGIVIPEETECRVELYARSAGPNVIKPLGLAMVKSNQLIKKNPT